VRDFGKADWIVRISQQSVRNGIYIDNRKMTELPGIGRKSANVIIREAGGAPQGIFWICMFYECTTPWYCSGRESCTNRKDIDEIIPRKLARHRNITLLSWTGNLPTTGLMSDVY